MSKQRNAITEEQVHAAMRKFREAGGLIRILPDEIVPLRNLVGKEWGEYEQVLPGYQIG